MKFYLIIIQDPEDYSNTHVHLTRSKQQAIEMVRNRSDWEIYEFSPNEIWDEPKIRDLTAYCMEGSWGGDSSFWPQDHPNQG